MLYITLHVTPLCVEFMYLTIGNLPVTGHVLHRAMAVTHRVVASSRHARADWKPHGYLCTLYAEDIASPLYSDSVRCK